MATSMADQMKKPRDIVVEWVDHILERKKWTGTDLARNSGLAPSTILRLLNDPDHPFVPSLKTMQKIAEGSGYPIPRKVTEALGAHKMEAPAEADEEMDNRRPARTRSLTVELKHVSSLPTSLQANATPNREMFIPAPPQIEGDDTAFAFYNPDGTFDPWCKSGSLMFATKRRDPVGGDMVLVTDKTGRSRIRMLMSINEEGLSLSKSLPVKDDEKVGFDEIGEIAIIAFLSKL